MVRKVITGIVAMVLVGTIVLFAAEKVKEKSPADKPRQDVKAFGEQEQKEGLLDQLIAAYQANDRGKMGEIIKKMAQRRDKMQKLAKLNKWHQGAHRKWAMAGWGANSGCGRDGAMEGAPRGSGWNRGCAGNLPAGRMEGRGGQQWGNAPCQTPARRGCCCGGMGGYGAMNEVPGQMCGHRPMRNDDGCGQGRGWEPRPGPGHRNMPPDNVPPVDWGW
jgi:hypothetical protein